MRKFFLKAFIYFACVVWSGMACAVGFGGINVTSALGQPLVAEIELVAVDKADRSSLNAHLASPEAFKGAGIDYPYALPKLKFQVETRANGESYIKASSDQAVNEPYVSLLLELTWSSGRLLREYTFLLDPPGFVAEQPPAQPIAPIEPVITSAVPAEVVPPVAAETPETVPQAASAVQADAAAEAAPAAAAEVAQAEEKKVEPVAKEEPRIAEEAAKKPTEANHAAAAPVTVKQGDTLAKIANQTKAPDVSLERMLVALYRANTDEFDEHNMNRIRTGKILRLPESAELAKIQQPEAVKEVHAQVADWNAYRHKLAGANTSASEQRAKQEVAGKISTSIADKVPVAKESAKEVLKLSKGDAAGDQTAAGGKEKLIAKEEDAIAKAKALKEAEQRAALLEKNIKDMQRLVELKNQAASAPPSTIPLIASAVVPTSAVAATSAVAEAKPKLKTVEPKVVVEPSLMDELMDDPVTLGGAAAAVLGLGWLGLVMSRRGKKAAKKVPVVHDEGPIASPVAPSPDTGDFTQTGAAAAAMPEPEDVDPIREADLFLNFGRDVQAEEVLKEALTKDPSNNLIKLKLLSIYSTRKDTKSFYAYAREIKESYDEQAWDQAAALGRELEPDNAFYRNGEDVVLAVNVPEEKAPEKAALDFDAPLPPALDFDLGDEEVEDASIKPAEKPSVALDMSAMDFDVGGLDTTDEPISFDEPKFDSSALDIDLGDVKENAPTAAPVAETTPSLNLDDLVFDAVPSSPADSAPAAELDIAKEFSIDFPSEEKPATATPSFAKDIGLSDISLNLDDPAPAAVQQTGENRDEHWQEVATKLDLAKAYQEMGDQAGAREILEEVVRDGDAAQRETAQSLLQQM